MATIILHEPWVKAEKLRAEGLKLWAEGDKLRAEGLKLWAEGRGTYLLAIKDFFGESLDVDWWTGRVKVLGKERVVMPLGELFGYDNLT